MSAQALNSLADLICRAQENGARTPMGIAMAIEAAGRHMSPEVAAEVAATAAQAVAAAEYAVAELEREHEISARLRRQVAELEAQRDRRRDRLVALQNDALNMRGALSPNGEVRKVPMPLGETLLPAVEWLINRVAELEAERHVTNEALADVTVALRGAQVETDPSACQGCGSLPEQWCPDCAACEKNCFGGFDGNKCMHANARWRRPSVDESADKLTRLLAPSDGEHYAAVHHTYQFGRELDFPQSGGAQ